MLGWGETIVWVRNYLFGTRSFLLMPCLQLQNSSVSKVLLVNHLFNNQNSNSNNKLVSSLIPSFNHTLTEHSNRNRKEKMTGQWRWRRRRQGHWWHTCSGYGLYFIQNKYYRYSTIEAGRISRNTNKLENIRPNSTKNSIFFI